MMKIKTLSAILLCSSALVASSAFAAEQNLVANMTPGYDLPANELQTFTGGWFKSSTLKCKVRSEADTGNTLSVLAMKKRVTVNGLLLQEGNSMSLMTHIGDTIHFELEARGKLGVTNNGEHLVNLRCY